VDSQDPVAVAAVHAIRTGDTAALASLLADHPGLAAEPIHQTRTPLHVAADWPGYFPDGPATVGLLIDAGADPNAAPGEDRPETPLHWAASSDDADVADALISGGANLETPGGSIGTPLDNAIGYGCWNVARLLVCRGARVDKLWHAAALGIMPRVEELLAATPPPSADDINEAFWQACHGGQRRTAERLLASGADLSATPGYSNQTPAETAAAPDTQRENLLTWLHEQQQAR
jgi:ankyrin repeat protein